MDGYGPSTYGERFADVYDHWYADVSDAAATVERVAALVSEAGGPVLELGGGSGRLAVPLAERGIATWAVDASLAMVRRLGEKPGGHRVHALVGDMAALPLSTGARFGVVLCAFNTFFNLTTIEAQRRCLAGVAERLAPDGGRFLVEAFVPPAGGPAVGSVEPRHIGLDELVLTVSRLDPASHSITGQHVQITEAGIRLRPWMLRYLSPEELDGLAAEAGLRLVERHAGWRAEPFSADSPAHVSTYALMPSG
ncbi:MAG TPA: class I SAM-dependent methyltransferase [Acidimicrobiales bacterium]|jgi:SAM-dependent methyltransferase|nr:class I SAM-dependent methyltransferase [Acidimicrobiales bacterium]